MANGGRLALTDLGTLCRRRHVGTAWRYLRGTHDTVSDLFKSLTMIRGARRLKDGKDRRGGRYSLTDQDILRAALVFSGAGLDRCLKHLLTDAVPVRLEASKGAMRAFRQHACEWQTSSPGIVSKVLSAEDPRAEMLTCYVNDITGASFQSTSQLLNVRRQLGIDSSEVPDDMVDSLKPFFKARNEIVHELDFTRNGNGEIQRRKRSKDEVREHCDNALQVVAMFVRAVNTAPSRSPARLSSEQFLPRSA